MEPRAPKAPDTDNDIVNDDIDDVDDDDDYNDAKSAKKISSCVGTFLPSRAFDENRDQTSDEILNGTSEMKTQCEHTNVKC